MAVQLYQPDKSAVTQMTTQTDGGAEPFSAQSTSDQKKIKTKLEDLKAEQRKKKYLGLSNQGATCYMNSFLQTLYMTPELREFLYEWNHIEDLHGDKAYSIPYQLQKLFTELQWSRRDNALTKDLTKSFGWGRNNSFEQQDA
jgi:ubiquitin carboxyl-terminal hydrolase 47